MICKKIKALLFLTFITGVSISVNGQEQDLDSSNQNKVIDKLIDLSQKGVEITNDSLIIGEEFQKLLTDKNYQIKVFPEKYTWEQTKIFINQQELKKAFWYMINLYSESPKDKEIVIGSILYYDNLFKMDKVLINTFYTYCYLDPEVGEINEGVPEILRPDILENKLNDLKEILGYIRYFRENESDN
ncbi:MAG: hypothetical protein ACOC2M_01565 [bacterium]